MGENKLINMDHDHPTAFTHTLLPATNNMLKSHNMVFVITTNEKETNKRDEKGLFQKYSVWSKSTIRKLVMYTAF